MQITDEMYLRLVQMLKEFLIEEFKFKTPKWTSLNLANTTYAIRNNDGISIHIPAQIFDEKKWKEEGIIVYTGEGSYAEQVNDIIGGHPKASKKLHFNYVERALLKIIPLWLKEYGITEYEIEGLDDYYSDEHP